jgi:protein-glutamine gamma-glutamyltransferase
MTASRVTTLPTPPLLLGVALLFWGWQSGLVLLGILLAVILESSRVVGLRWDLTEKDFRRLYEFCVIFFVGTTLYLFASNDGASALAGLVANPSSATQNRVMAQSTQALLVLFRWTPVIFFLFVAAQAYSTCPFIPRSVVSLIWRRRLARQKAPPPPGPAWVNTAYPYFAVCLLAASVPVAPGPFFFVGFAPLLAWGLWQFRSPRYHPALWVGMLVLVAGAGFLAQRAFLGLSIWAEGSLVNFAVQFIAGHTDPKESRTALGQIGNVKLSGRIVLRLQPKEASPVPSLLREASYRFFKSPDWVGAGKKADFEHAGPGSDLTTWQLAPGRPTNGAVTIAQYLTGHGEDARRGLLALPQGIVKLENLRAFVLSTNRLGVVRVDEGPGLVVYDAYWQPRSTIDAPPEREDLEVPLNESAVLTQVVAQIQLQGKTTDQKLRALSAYFTEHFQYSTWLPSSRSSRSKLTPLAYFLLRAKKGHCEYFATAATLLLREAGVPARYAVGYAVQERAGGQYIVRERHAHAWCLVWRNGAWEDFDVTPPSWSAVEAARASRLEWLSDAWSRIWFEFSKWRWGVADWRNYVLWVVGPVLGLLLARLLLGKRWKRLRGGKAGAASSPAWPGADSEFFQLESAFAGHGLYRAAHETPLDWLARLRAHPLMAALGESFQDVLRLHYRYRFDPAGLGPTERAELRSTVQQCLRKLKRRSV